VDTGVSDTPAAEAHGCAEVEGAAVGGSCSFVGNGGSFVGNDGSFAGNDEAAPGLAVVAEPTTEGLDSFAGNDGAFVRNDSFSDNDETAPGRAAVAERAIEGLDSLAGIGSLFEGNNDLFVGNNGSFVGNDGLTTGNYGAGLDQPLHEREIEQNQEKEEDVHSEEGDVHSKEERHPTKAKAMFIEKQTGIPLSHKSAVRERHSEKEQVDKRLSRPSSSTHTSSPPASPSPRSSQRDPSQHTFLLPSALPPTFGPQPKVGGRSFSPRLNLEGLLGRREEGGVGKEGRVEAQEKVGGVVRVQGVERVAGKGRKARGMRGGRNGGQVNLGSKVSSLLRVLNEMTTELIFSKIQLANTKLTKLAIQND